MSDTIDVRNDERFDAQKLADYLADKRDILEVGDAPFSIRQFGGGMANLTYEIDFGEKQFVLRRPPLGPVAKSAHDMGREYKVLSRLYQKFPLAPRAYLFCDDHDVIGADFFIMARHYGAVVRKSMPVAFQAMPEAPKQMSTALAEALADFHAVDYKEIGLGDLGKPEGFISRQIEGWHRRWHKAKHEEIPLMDTLYEWLKENEPQNTIATLVHNDYKLDNVMVNTADPRQLEAIFDWDMCTLGDPMSDVGTLMTYWSDPDDPPYMKMLAANFLPVGDYNFLTRQEMMAVYAERSGRDISDLNFYHALGLFRLTVILAQIYIRYVRGQTQDKRFAALGQMLPLLVQSSADVAGL